MNNHLKLRAALETAGNREMSENMYLLKGSEKLSEEFNALGDFYSDFYKEFYGVRPRIMALYADQYHSHKELQEAYSHLRRLTDGLRNAALMYTKYIPIRHLQ